MVKCLAKNLHGLAGSLNYLWTTTALMAYLYTVYGYFVENQDLKVWQKILVSLCGFLVGFSHEVMAFVGGAFLGVLFLGNIRKVWKSSKWDTLFLIGTVALFALGAILTIIAPGNLARSMVDVTENKSALACLGNYKDIKWQLVIIVVSMIWVGFLKQKELLKKEIIYFILPCIIATIPFSIMGYFTPRCFVPYEALLISIVSANSQIIASHFSERKKGYLLICGILTIIAFSRMLPTTYSDIRYILPYKIKLTKQLEQARENGEKDVIVSKFLFMDKICREDLINVDNFFLETSTASVVNTYLSLYYKFDRIRAISDADYFIEIDTDIVQNVDYGILNKDTLELISIVSASDKICFTIPKEQFGKYVVDCRDKDLRSHVKSVRIRAVGEEMPNPDLEMLINQER